MKFFLLLSSCLAVVCRLTSAAPSILHLPEDEIDDAVINLKCPTGERPAIVYAPCPYGVELCSHLGLRCVSDAWYADGQPSGSSGTGSTNARKSDEELEREVANTQCPAGLRPSLVKKTCPDARDPEDCPPPQVKCVPKSFGNDQPITQRPGTISTNPSLTQAELERELMDMTCPFGQRPAFVKERCPPGATDTRDCPPMAVRCVQSSFANNQPSTPRTDGARPMAAPKTREELNQEMMHLECPFGQRPAQVKVKCPYGATNVFDCPPTEVKCVRSSFGNGQPGTGIAGPGGSRPSPKTQSQLESDLMHQQCAFGYRAAFVKESCPTGATNTLDCYPTEVRCVQSSFANDQPSTPKPNSNGPRAPAKTQEDLDREMMHKECPFGQRAAQVKEKCPYGEFDTLYCPATEVRCVQSSFGNEQS